jgi:hypothetical protein
VIRLIALALALGAAADAAASAAAPAVCNHRPAAAAALARLREALAHGRFVAYQPTSLQVTDGRFIPADPASIRADLAVLRPRFDSLVTYEALHGAENIPSIAASLKFRALIIGVWNPLDDAEVSAAIDAARHYPRLVTGVSLGNERLFSKRSDFAGLIAVIASVRARLPDTPLSTSEPFHMYYPESAAALLGELDFLLVKRASHLPAVVPRCPRGRRRAVGGERGCQARAELLRTHPREGDWRAERTGERRLQRGAAGIFLPRAAPALPRNPRSRVRVLRRVRCPVAQRGCDPGAWRAS